MACCPVWLMTDPHAERGAGHGALPACCSCSLLALGSHTPVCPHRPSPTGAASQFVMMRAAGALVGGALGLLVSYLTYWANGSSYESTTTKGAVMVTLLSFFSFCFGLYRFRYPRWWFGFTVATFRCVGCRAWGACGATPWAVQAGWKAAGCFG